MENNIHLSLERYSPSSMPQRPVYSGVRFQLDYWDDSGQIDGTTPPVRYSVHDSVKVAVSNVNLFREMLQEVAEEEKNG